MNTTLFLEITSIIETQPVHEYLDDTLKSFIFKVDGKSKIAVPLQDKLNIGPHMGK